MLIVSLIIALFFLVSFLWAAKSGQYDDDYTPAVRILFDNESLEELKQSDNGSTTL